MFGTPDPKAFGPNENTIAMTHYSTIVVSTIKCLEWSGRAEPWPYETMVFPTDGSQRVTDWCDLDVNRYRTEEAAKAGHVAMVDTWIEMLANDPNRGIYSPDALDDAPSH